MNIYKNVDVLETAWALELTTLNLNPDCMLLGKLSYINVSVSLIINGYITN